MDHKVSIIIACYNHAEYLPEAVGSVIQQTYKNWECIIVNDGSTDNSEEAGLQLAAENINVHYYRKENGGLSSARNFGIERSNGTYILPLDADDKIHPTYVEKALKAFKTEDVKIVYCDAEYFGARSGKLLLPDFSRKQLAEMNMIFCSAMFKKQDFISAGGYNTNMKFGWEDWNLWIGILKHGGEVVKIPEVLFYYRQKDASMLVNLEGSRKQNMFMQLYLNHPDFFDEYHSEPIEIFDNYRKLKRDCQALEADNAFLKGLLKLQPSSYKALLKRMFKRNN